MRMLRTQNSYSESFTQQISSVFTEQFRNGVNNPISIKVRKNQIRRRLQKKEKLWTRKHRIPWTRRYWKRMDSQGVNYLVSTPRNPPASRNGLRENLENFELWSRITQIAKVSLWVRIILGPSGTWKILQIHARRRSWFCRFYTRIPRNTFILDMIQKP